MNLMQTRYDHLMAVCAGYLQTGIHFVEVSENGLRPLKAADDLGIYFFIPTLSKLLNISCDQTITLFFTSLLIVPVMGAMIAFFKLYDSWSQRCLSWCLLLLLTRFAYAVGDVYLAYFACVVGIIPWSFYFVQKSNAPSSGLFSFFIGIYSGFLNTLRAYSSVGGLIYLLMLLFQRQMPFNKKILFCLMLSFGFFVPHLYLNRAYNTHQFYKGKMGDSPLDQNGHVFWHTIYLGFGFLRYKNEQNICYDDAFAFDKIKNKYPSIELCSQEYEAILRNEVIDLIKHDWVFVLFTIFAKIGILLFLLLKFANIGLLASIFNPMPFKDFLAFFIAGCFYALFPLIAIPNNEYALGFICVAMMYNIMSLCQTFEGSVQKQSRLCYLNRKIGIN